MAERARLELWGPEPPCGVCGSRYLWALKVTPGSARILLGCPRGRSVAEALAAARRVIARLAADP